jgi:hypothetical protein
LEEEEELNKDSIDMNVLQNPNFDIAGADHNLDMKSTFQGLIPGR